MLIHPDICQELIVSYGLSAMYAQGQRVQASFSLLGGSQVAKTVMQSLDFDYWLC